MSSTLMLGALYGILIAAMLWWTSKNRLANRALALLLIAFALRLAPYIIGYAGFYDKYPWLSFAPYDFSLSFGPLLYFYVVSLTTAKLPARWLLHLVPVALQFGYYSVLFSFPLAFKKNWDGAVHTPFVYPLETFAALASLAIYWWLSHKHYRRYQIWLTQNFSDREDFHLEWIRNFLIALSVTLLVWASFALFEQLVEKLNYFQRFPFYVWLTVLVYYLGTEGYRQASRRYPIFIPQDAMAEIEQSAKQPAAATVEQTAEALPDAPSAALTSPLAQGPAPLQLQATQPPTTPVERDWLALGVRWREAVAQHEWWRDPDLNLSQLARKLGTNTSHLSRAINEGLGQNFNEMVNALRVEAVKKRLAHPDESRDLLDIAFEAGFSSKASFNRSFKTIAGITPTTFRALALQEHNNASAIL